jgi:hypothetical protein
MIAHAKMLRGLITTIPGKPCVVANCHPVKNAAADNLLPAGGGSFLNEIDGNMTAFKNESDVTLNWQCKFRGVEFAPEHFLVKTVTSLDLKDSRGRLVPTVICEWVSDQEQEKLEADKRKDEDRILAMIAADPDIQLAQIAAEMDWKLYSGKPNKMKAKRAAEALVKAKLIKATRGSYRLTPEGEKALKAEGNVNISNKCRVTAIEVSELQRSKSVTVTVTTNSCYA